MTYAYDAFNQLVKRTIQQATTDPTTTGIFVHDGNQIVLELEPDGDVTHRLLWGPAVDMALADETGAGTTYWQFADHQGTVRDVAIYNTSTDVTTVANHIAFDTFGRRTSETNSALGDFDVGYTGKWLDRATGLQWNLNRWYNPSIQRWMSEDPIGFGGGDANFGRYVGNRPQAFTDPSGLEDDDSLRGPRKIPGSPTFWEEYWRFAEYGNSAPADHWLLNWGNEIADAISLVDIAVSVGKQAVLQCGKIGARKATATITEKVVRDAIIHETLAIGDDFILKKALRKTVLDNAESGRNFEALGVRYVEEIDTNVVTQISIRPYTESGELARFRIRLDAIGTNCGVPRMYDFKSSLTAGLTKNQKLGYPMLEKFGGAIVGRKGGAIYPPGRIIAPAPVQIVRPGIF